MRGSLCRRGALSCNTAWRGIPATALLALPLLFGFAQSAEAQTTLVSNTAQSQDAQTSIETATAFTTGANAYGYTLSAVDIQLTTASAASDTVVTIRQGGTNPGNIVATLTNPNSFTSNALNTFTAPADTVLAASTTYFLVFNDGRRANPGAVASVSLTNSDAQTGAAGWSIANSNRSRISSWSSGTASIRFAVKGTAAGPAKPTGFTATPGPNSGQVTLRWTDPEDNRITRWQYDSWRGTPGAWGGWRNFSPGAGPGATSGRISGLNNGTQYGFRVRARAGALQGAASDAATATPAANPPPAKPTGLTATPGDGTVILSWDNPNNSNITHWQRRVRTGGGAWSTWSSVAAGSVPSFRLSLTGLINGTTYEYQIRATIGTPGADGTLIGPASDAVSATPMALTPTVEFASATSSAPEGTLITPILRIANPGASFVLGYAVTGTATRGTDFTVPASVTVDADAGAAVIFVSVSQDALREPDETVIITLADGDGYDLGSRTVHTATIANDDPPLAPAGLTAAAGDGEVTLSWTDPSDADISVYEFRRRAPAGTGSWGSWTMIASSTAATTTHTVTGLANGTEYGFQVRAADSAQLGAASAEATATPTAARPAAPTNFTAVAGPGGGQVTLRWTRPSGTITGYQYRVRPPGQSWFGWAVMTGGADITSFVASVGNEALDFQMRARNGNAEGEESAIVRATAVARPAAPTSVTAVAGPRSGEVTLGWGDPSNSAITKYQYRQKLNSASTWGEWTDFTGGTTATSTSGTVAGLTNGTAYDFEVRATAAPGGTVEGAASATVTATPSAPPAKPAGFTARGFADNSVTLSWTRPSNNAITKWQYRRKLSSAITWGEWTDIPGDPRSNRYSVSGLTIGTTYDFQVRALVGTVEGAASDTATATPTAALLFSEAARFFTLTALTVVEEATGSYRVRLAGVPSGEVTVTIASDNSDVTVDTDSTAPGNQDTLTFTTTNWGMFQTVTVSAADDGDTAEDTATLTHTASGGGYDTLTGNVTVAVTVTDNDTAGLVLNPTALTVDEGDSGTYTVALATLPTGNVTVTVAGASGEVTVDTDTSTPNDQNTLSFTTTTWSTPQTVTVSAGNDGDTTNDSATLTHTASGGGYGSVTGNVVVTVEDDDTVGVTTATTDDTATEGSTSDTATFTVVLNTQPSSNVAVTVTAPAGLELAGPGGSTFSGSALIAFTASTWGTAQTVTVRATDDNTDSPIGRELSVTYSTSSRDNNYHSLSGDAATVTVVDDDATTVTLAGSAGNIEEGETKTFTVTLGRGLVNGETLPVPLTFTGGATRGTDYTTACPTTLPTGVTCANLDSGNAMVTFTGPSTGTTSRTVTLTLTAATDNTAETGGETVMIGLGTLNASSGTGLGGGASGTGSLSFSITDPSATDTTVPTLSISGVPGTISTRAAFTANFTFSESVTDFDTNDITVTGGSKGTLSGSGRSYRMRITPTGGVNVVVTVRRNAATDGTNRGPAAAVSRTATWRAPSPPPQQPPAEEEDDDDPPSAGEGGTPSLPSASLSAVSVSAGQMVIEGGEALFRITASPVPSDEITVRVRVSATGDFVEAVQLGERLVTLSASAPTASLRVATTDDKVNEADGTVTVTVLAGGGYTLSQTSASLAVTDDDTPALFLTPETLTVDEGGSANYRVALATEPAGDVTVSIAGTGEVTTAQNTLTFTAGNWSTAQPVTVSAGQDADAADDRARLDHRASGGGYDSVTGSVAVTVMDDDTPGLILTPAALTLAEGASASYTVALATEPTGNVTVSIAGTGDVTVDRSTLSFTARNWSAAQTVTAFAARDEDVANDSATLAHHARGGDYSSVTGSVEVTVTDAGAAVVSAHLARFGRTVAEQALDGIAGRLRAPRTAGMQKTLAGPRLNVPREGDTAQGTMHAEARRTGFENEYESQSRDLLHLPNAREMLLGSSFTLTTQEAEGTGGSFAFWGRASANRFDGATNEIGLDGEVLTGLVGADYARGDWLFGLALTHSLSEGGYTSEGANAGKVDASLTAALPYLSLQANPRLKLWGAGGYGIGEVTLKTGGASYRADTDWTMAAAGVRGDLLDAAGNRPAVAVIGDGLWMRSTSDEIAALSTADTFVTRLRLGVEASYDFNFDGMGDLTPRVEAGARHDGGDAETGAGMDLGVGINWKAPVFGLSLDVAGRMLILHENEDFADRGISAAVVFDPNPESERGPSLSLRQAIGGSAEGGIEALFATTTPLDGGGQIGSGAGIRRTLETAYGFSAFGGRFTASPHAEVDFTERARDYALGWRFVPHKLASDLAFGIKATRREGETLAPVHVFGVEATVRW